MAEPDIEERLSQFWIFADFSQDELAQVASFVEEKTLATGSTLFRQGDPAGWFYLVESGVVQEVGKDAAGLDVLRRRAEAGDHIGHRSLMGDLPRRATAIVIENTRLLATNCDDFRTLLAMFPRLQEQLQRTKVVNRLLAIPLFCSFSEEQLFDVADLVRRIEYPPGQTIFQRGEPPDALYVIDTGQVVERAPGMAMGKLVWPRYFTAGSFFGHHGLMNNTIRRATAGAVTDVTLFRLGADAFHWLRKAQPEFEDALKRHDVVGRLRQTDLFSELSEDELKHLAGYVGLAHFRPQHVLYRQGEIDPTLYMLHEGEAIVRARDEEGRERPRGYLKVGDAVGEASLFLQEPRDVTVEATTKTNWFYLTRADLDQFLTHHPILIDKVVPREEVRARRRLRRLPWMEPDEQLVMRRQRHWFFPASRVVWAGLLMLVTLIVFIPHPVLAIIGWPLLVIALGWTLWLVIDWLNDYYVVTTARVAHREKVLLVRETRDETPLDKIQNMNIQRGLVGNTFGFGTLFIDTAAATGAARVTFDYLADPDGVQKSIFEQIRRARAGERVHMRRVIRDKLEQSMGPSLRAVVPRPAVPSAAPSSPPSPPRPGILERIGGATWQRVFWIEQRTDDQVQWRKHWVRLWRHIWMPALAVAGLLLVLAAYSFGFGALSPWFVMLLLGLLLLSIGWLWWNWEDWGNDRYIVTTDRIIDVEALPWGFRSKRTEATFDRIQNVSFVIPTPMATILDYGTVEIYTAGAEGRLDFEWVRDPKGVQAEIFRRMAAYEETQRSQQREERWADLPQWFAVYKETQRP